MISPLNKTRRGFTLLEMLVGVAVFAVLAILSTLVAGKVMDSSRRARGVSDLRQIGIAIHLYASDHNGEIPPVSYDPKKFREGLIPPTSTAVNDSSFAELLIPEYLPNNEVFFAPADLLRRANRDPVTGWAKDPGSNKPAADRHSYWYIYMNPAPHVVNSQNARPVSEGGYGEVWNVMLNHPSKVVAHSVYFDNLWPVYKDGTMVLRLGGSVQWYDNSSFKRFGSVRGQFDQKDYSK